MKMNLDVPLFCTFCGAELVPTLERHNSGLRASVYMTCPNRKRPSWLNFWKDSRHEHYFIGVEDIPMNYDPLTGEKRSPHS